MALFSWAECLDDDIAFNNAFKNKLLMYLYEDVVKYKKNDLLGAKIILMNKFVRI